MRDARSRYINKSFEALFMNSLDAIVRIDANYCVADINRPFVRLFGYELDEIKGMHVDEVMNMGREGSADGSITEAVISGKQIECEGIRYNKAGRPLAVLIKGIPITIDGKLAGSFGIYSDISPRKRIEADLQNQRERLQNIIEGSNVGTWEWNLQSGATVYNEIWAQIVGYSLEELSPLSVKTWETLLQPDDLKKSDELIKRHIDGELPIYECECRMKHKDGHWVWVHDRGRIVTYNTDGTPLMMFGTLTDITERKQAEAHILYMSLHDSLTGLYNRAYLDEEMRRLDTARQMPISIIMADLNGLKLVNDTYGHYAGDEILKYASEILKKSCRREDIIARWGGDEFVILLPQTTIDEAFKLVKRLEANCSSARVINVPVSMALGVASKTAACVPLAETLREAENNMYKQKLTESRSTKNSVLKALLKTLEAKSYETEIHTRRMQALARKIGDKLNLPDAELNRLNLLITLHDIGKINISEDILIKQGSLTEEEWDTIRKHPEIGFRIARATEEFAHVANEILAHHENWNGSGYPQGLKGKQIPLLARITAIADSYEVMTYGRPYKKAMSAEEVNAEFKRCSGSQFDPGLVEIFLTIEDKNGE
jgi:diguanylate cyclase (GGDEF)-like protein/PAS domain S-box-containing protein